jgi:hypothetical protein
MPRQLDDSGSPRILLCLLPLLALKLTLLASSQPGTKDSRARACERPTRPIANSMGTHYCGRVRAAALRLGDHYRRSLIRDGFGDGGAAEHSGPRAASCHRWNRRGDRHPRNCPSALIGSRSTRSSNQEAKSKALRIQSLMASVAGTLRYWYRWWRDPACAASGAEENGRDPVTETVKVRQELKARERAGLLRKPID